MVVFVGLNLTPPVYAFPSHEYLPVCLTEVGETLRDTLAANW